MLGSTGLFCYFNSIPNLLHPFFLVSISLDFNVIKEVEDFISSTIDINNIEDYSYEELLLIITKLTEFIRRHREFIDIDFYKLGKYELEKYGIESSFRRGLKHFKFLYPFNSIKVGATHEIVEGQLAFRDHAELLIGYILSRAIREYYLKDYNVGDGACTREHYERIIRLRRLPTYYVEIETIHFLIKGIRSLKELPKWTYKYLNKHYAQFIK